MLHVAASIYTYLELRSNDAINLMHGHTEGAWYPGTMHHPTRIGLCVVHSRYSTNKI